MATVLEGWQGMTSAVAHRYPKSYMAQPTSFFKLPRDH